MKAETILLVGVAGVAAFVLYAKHQQTVAQQQATGVTNVPGSALGTILNSLSGQGYTTIGGGSSKIAVPNSAIAGGANSILSGLTGLFSANPTYDPNALPPDPNQPVTSAITISNAVTPATTILPGSTQSDIQYGVGAPGAGDIFTPDESYAYG